MSNKPKILNRPNVSVVIHQYLNKSDNFSSFNVIDELASWVVQSKCPAMHVKSIEDIGQICARKKHTYR